LKLNLSLHTRLSKVALKPIYSVPPTAMNPISTHLAIAGALDSALLMLCTYKYLYYYRYYYYYFIDIIIIRAVERLIFLIALIARLIILIAR